MRTIVPATNAYRSHFGINGNFGTDEGCGGGFKNTGGGSCIRRVSMSDDILPGVNAAVNGGILSLNQDSAHI